MVRSAEQQIQLRIEQLDKVAPNTTEPLTPTSPAAGNNTNQNSSRTRGSDSLLELENNPEMTDNSEDLMAMHEATFDHDKTLYCKVENGHTLVHGAGGRGYGLGSTPIVSGCYQWKVSCYVPKYDMLLVKLQILNQCVL